MNNLLNDIKTNLKRLREKGKQVREEMSMAGKIFNAMTVILGLFFIVFLLSASFSSGTFELNVPLMILMCIIFIPIALINEKIQKSALEKYRAKLKNQNLEFCPYCGEKLELLQKFCPFCEKQIEESVEMEPETHEFRKKLRKKSSKKDDILSKSEEIYSIKRYSFSSVLVTCIIFSVILSIIFSFLFGDFSMLFTFLIAMLLFSIFFSVFVLWIINSSTTYSQFMISSDDIQLVIEKKLFFRVTWSEVRKIDLYRLRFNGYYVKINYSDTFKLIRLDYCGFPKNRQKEIVEFLFAYADEIGCEISLTKIITPLLNDVGEREIQKEIYKFARTRRFIFRPYRD